MTLIKTFDDDDRHDQDLAAAEDLWKEAGRIFAHWIKKAQQDEDALNGVKHAASEYVSSHKLVVTERSRVADERRKQTGANGNYAIDFDAARDEIGRRLACLRDAGAS